MRKAALWLSFCLFAILSSGCNITHKTHLGQEPIDGNIQFGISESYANYNLPSHPQIFLSLKTEKIYGCMNYQIANTITIKNGTVDVRISGITVPEICLTALGPATAKTSLDLPNGNYKLVLHSGTFSNSYNLSVTDRSISIDPSSYSETQPLYRLYWRYPPTSFVYVCGTLTQDSTICTDFLDTLKSKMDLQEFVFPDSGKVPYPTASDGHYYDMPAKYFYYKNDAAFDKIGDIMKEYKVKYLSNKTGYGISIINWMNKSFYSWLL